MNIFSFLFDSEYRSQAIDYLASRAIPILLGTGICIVGIVFVVSGTKAGQVATELGKIAVTKKP